MNRRQALKGIATLAGAAALPLPNPVYAGDTPVHLSLSGSVGGRMIPPDCIMNWRGRLYHSLSDRINAKVTGEKWTLIGKPVVDAADVERNESWSDWQEDIAFEAEVFADTHTLRECIHHEAARLGYDPEPCIEHIISVGNGDQLDRIGNSPGVRA